MISYLKTRILASAATLLVVLHPAAGHCAPVPASAAATPAVQMDHISIVAMGANKPGASPVILIPGLSSPRATWDGIAPELATTHRVYLVQVNGFGGDDPRANLQPGILNGIVADLSAFIAREKIVKPAIVGHSMGGLAGLMFAKAHPDQVGRLTIVDSLPFIGTLFAPTATVAMVEPQAKAIAAQMASGYGKPANPAAAEATAKGLALKPESQAKAAAWFAAADPRVSGQALYEDMTTDMRPDLPGIATPITLVYAYSAGLPRERADAVFQGSFKPAPNVTFVPVGDSMHFIMLDQPAAFQAAMTAFLAK
ncbi:alpha/beta hydrolase [soil metagenome]